MAATKLTALSVVSFCLTVVMLVFLIAAWVSLHNDIGRLETRISDLEERQKYIEYRLLENEKPTCGSPCEETD